MVNCYFKSLLTNVKTLTFPLALGNSITKERVFVRLSEMKFYNLGIPRFGLGIGGAVFLYCGMRHSSSTYSYVKKDSFHICVTDLGLLRILPTNF